MVRKVRRRSYAALCTAALAIAAMSGALASAGTASAATGTTPKGPSAATPAAVRKDASVTNPYSPAYQHPYRHGAVPTLATQAKMKSFSAAGDPTPGGTGNRTLSYGGGIDNIGVQSGHSKVYLVFYGSQWGTRSTDANGNATFTGDPAGAAPVAQQMFKGIGTGNESWSAVLTQWCDGPDVPAYATSCPANSTFIPYQAGGVLAGVWYDNSVASPAQATGHQLGVEAVAAAAHFGNTTAASNRNAYYVILSPHGTNPDNYQAPDANNGFCAWHDYNGDSFLTGGPVASSYGDIAFSNQPYNIDLGAACGVGFINTPGTLDGFTITLGHEWSEMMTDQNPAGGWINQTGDATYNGEENADECAWIAPGDPGGVANVTFATGTFAQQSSWSNDTNNCAISHAIVTHPLAPAVRFADPAQWASNVCLDGETCEVADVNGDKIADLVEFTKNTSPDNPNSAFVELGTGSGSGPAQKWSSLLCLAGETCVLGDVNNDGKADAVAFTRNNGPTPNAVYVGLSTGSGFGSPQLWSSFFCQLGESCRVADVNGDGKADVIALSQGGTTPLDAAWVALSTGTSFGSNAQWSSNICTAGQRCLLGDVNGDHKADVVAFDQGFDPNYAGKVVVSTSTGNAFSAGQLWASGMCRKSETCDLGDVNNDGYVDAVAFTQVAPGSIANTAWVALATPLTLPHGVPTTLTTTADSATVSWLGGPCFGCVDAQYWDVYKRNNSGWWTLLHTFPNDLHTFSKPYSFIDTNVNPGGDCYSVAARNSLGTDWAEVFDRTVCGVRTDPALFSQTVTPAVTQFQDLDARNGFARDLYSTVKKQYLVHQGQTFGIDLGWTSSLGSAYPNVTVVGEARLGSTLLKGEDVALNVAGGGYLHFNGNGMEFVSSPSYEWRVLGGDPDVPTVAAPGPDQYEGFRELDYGQFALWNDNRKDFLVAGINATGGPGAVPDMTWASQLTVNPVPQHGIKTDQIYNCSLEQHQVEVFVRDLTAGTAWSDQGSIDFQGGSGGCPAIGSSPLTFTPTSGHSYFINVQDFQRAGCASHDPTDGSCNVMTDAVVGDSSGLTEISGVNLQTRIF